MIRRLPRDPTGEKDYRSRLDGELKVRHWPSPGQKEFIRPTEEELKAPHWWKGDEEASSSFLSAVGVKL